MKMIVYLLQHSYELDNGYDETKILGIFSSKQKAKEVLAEYKQLPGFKEKPNNFLIDEYELDKKNWIEGFGFDG